MKRLTAVAILLALSIASCGGGNEPVNDGINREPAACACDDEEAEPVGPDDEVIEECNRFCDLAFSVYEVFPNLPAWRSASEEREGELNGTARVRALGKTVHEWHQDFFDERSPEWKKLRARGILQTYYDRDDETPALEDVLKAIRETVFVASEMESLRQYDRIALVVYEDGTPDLLDIFYALRAPIHRFELLVAANMIEQAKKELSDWVRVMSAVDGRNSAIESLMYIGLVSEVYRTVISQRNRRIHDDKEIHDLLLKLVDDETELYWASFKNELAYTAHLARDLPEHAGDSSAADWRASQRGLRARIAVAKRFGNPPMNPLEGEVLKAIETEFLEHGDREQFETWASHIYHLAKLHAYRLALKLRAMDVESPLFERIKEIYVAARDYEFISAKVDEQTGHVTLKIAPKHPLDTIAGGAMPDIYLEFDLHRPEPEEED